jgi:hypothetical protein
MLAEYSVVAYTRSTKYPGTDPWLSFSGIGTSKLFTLGELAIQFF